VTRVSGLAVAVAIVGALQLSRARDETLEPALQYKSYREPGLNRL